jgi:hypothetical protein
MHCPSTPRSTLGRSTAPLPVDRQTQSHAMPATPFHCSRSQRCVAVPLAVSIAPLRRVGRSTKSTRPSLKKFLFFQKKLKKKKSF